MDVEKIYKEIHEEKLAWSRLNHGYSGIAHVLEEVDHPDKKRLEEILKDYTPDELKKLEAVKKGARKQTTLRVNISDLKKIGKLIDSLELVTEENSRLQAIETKLKDAKESYHKTPVRQETKLRIVARILGITKDSKRQKKIPQKDIFWEYISLIKDPDPMDKWEALENLAKKFGLKNSNAARQHVQGYLGDFKKNYELLCHYEKLSNFTSNPKNKPGQFKGILPPIGIYKN